MPSYPIRSLFRRPGLSVMIVTILALAIGANTAIYSVAKAVVLTPLPFRDPDRVVQIFEGGERDRYQPGGENYMSSVRASSFQDWREQCRSFESMAAVRNGGSLIGGDRPIAVASVVAGDGLFETLGTAPQIGRYFNVKDYAADGPRVVVLSHRVWTQHFSADPSIIGRDIPVDGAATRVIGVMPAGFYPTRGAEPEVWLPLRWDPATKYSPTFWGHLPYARLKPGVTLEQAQAELDLVAAHTRRLYPRFYDRDKGVVVPVAGFIFGQPERLFWLLLGAVGLVLLIGCANIANLMLARSFERQREFAVRAALGASRGVIVRLVLTESLILASAGGLLGALLAPMLTQPALALLPAASRIPRLDQVHIDGNVLIFTLLISAIAGLLFGIAPSLRAARGDLSAGMGGGRGNSLGGRERRLTDTLVLAEVALSVVLLMGAGLLLRAFLNLLHSDPGFRPAQAVAAQLFVPPSAYGVYEVGGRNLAWQQLNDRLERALEGSGGIEAVGITARLPLRHLWNPGALSIEGRPPLPPDRLRGGRSTIGSGEPKHGSTSLQQVTPGYFAALGIPLLRGRLFEDRDRPEAPMVSVINETAARMYFPNEDPIGKRITVDMTSYFPKMTVVGIVGDSRMNGMDREIAPQVFWPMAYFASPTNWIVVRSKAGAEPVAEAVRSAVHRVAPDVAITEVASMTEILGDSLWRQRFAAILVGFFAVLAGLIASAGLYAVISYAVARQTRELGVRMALGATGPRIAASVLGRGLCVTTIGIGVGSLLAVVANRWLRGQVPDLGESPWMLAAVAGLLLFMTVLACWVPVRRALAVDPLTALRSE
jgi:putative ABC transport system permease protein